MNDETFTEIDAAAEAVEVALSSTCSKSQRGVVVFHGRMGVVASGWNRPPHPFACERSDSCRAHCNKVCLHAEEAALIDLAAGGNGRLGLGHSDPGSPIDLEMLHVKVVDGAPVPSGAPSCWQCSRKILAWTNGLFRIAKMWLLHESGWTWYSPLAFHTATLHNCGLPSAIRRTKKRK